MPAAGDSHGFQRSVDRLLSADCIRYLDRVRRRAHAPISAVDSTVLMVALTEWRDEALELIADSGPHPPELGASAGRLRSLIDEVEDTLVALSEWRAL